MTRQYKLHTNFTAGELDPKLLGRADLRAYENGASRLRNVTLHPTGGVSRRAGLRFLADLPGGGRLIGLEFNTDQFYVLVLSHLRLDVYQDGVLIQGNIAAPWHDDMIPDIVWVQSADTLFIAHPELRTRLITRQGPGNWRIDDLRFAVVGQFEMIPYHKFAPPDSEMRPSGTDGTITLDVDTDTFVADKHIGVPFRLNGGEVKIASVTSPTQAEATIREPLQSADPTLDWAEAAISPARGWPATVAFHQNRLVLGGAANLPNHIWMSKIDDIFNFDLGTGLDDEAIHFELLAGEVNAVRGLLSRGELQVFTSGGEWLITGDPLTPATVQAKRQTRIGSRADRYVPPRDVDGATLFVSRDGNKVSEFAAADVEQTFIASDLSLLARHQVDDVTDLDYEDGRRIVHGVRADGTLATLTQYRAERVTAWAEQVTDGTILSVAVAGGFVYLMVARDGGVFLEVLEEDLHLDSAISGSADPPTDTWSGLDHLEGQSVEIVADGKVHPARTVTDGEIVLDDPATEVVAGLGYTHEVAPLPPLPRNALGLSYATRMRLVQATFRLHETADLHVDLGEGPEAVSFQDFGEDVLDTAPAPFTGDKVLRALGWRSADVTPLWRILGTRPLPFTLLSVTTEIKVND
jgi:hypothetical protein